MEDLKFVSSLGTADEITPSANAVNSGTHTDCILKESLRPLGKHRSAKSSLPDSYILATSFPDILPDSGKQMLERAEAIFTRGEFIRLRAVSQMTDILMEITDSIAKAAPPVIYHRLTDYNPTEFNFLTDKAELSEIRGSARLLANPELLEQELSMVNRWQEKGKKVRIILPYVASPNEQQKIQDIVKKIEPDQIGIMVERVSHAERIAEYPLCDFVFPGPADLTADYQKISRGSYREGNVTEQQVLDLALRMSEAAFQHGIGYVLAIKILAGKLDVTRPELVKNVYMPNQLVN